MCFDDPGMGLCVVVHSLRSNDGQQALKYANAICSKESFKVAKDLHTLNPNL